jgi:hypothetical protein
MEQFIQYLEQNQITPNCYVILWSIGAKRRFNIKSLHTELRLLVNNDYLTDQYSITPKGQALLDGQPEVSISGTAAPVVHSNEYIDKYLLIFPKGKLPSGKSARVNRKNIEQAFKWFFDNYEYDWDTVLRATLYYVETYEKTNFMYMKNSQYFIRKQVTGVTFDSELANYCDIILNGEDDEPAHFTERVV